MTLLCVNGEILIIDYVRIKFYLRKKIYIYIYIYTYIYNNISFNTLANLLIIIG